MALVLFTLQRKLLTNLRRSQFKGYLLQPGCSRRHAGGSTLVGIVLDEEKNGYVARDQCMRYSKGLDMPGVSDLASA